jgi:hypothetical protein
MKLTSYEKMFLREAQCDYVLAYWAARSLGMSRHATRREAVVAVLASAAVSRVKFLLAHHRLWATHVIRASIADEA